MTLIQKFAAGFCLLLGLPILILGTVEALNPSTPAEDREGAIAAVVLFGAPPTALGGWLLWNVRHQNQTKEQQIEHAREQLFLKLLQENEGSITVLRFASEAAIPLVEAKEFLDLKARQLNASFDTTDEGGIIYRFTM